MFFKITGIFVISEAWLPEAWKYRFSFLKSCLSICLQSVGFKLIYFQFYCLNQNISLAELMIQIIWIIFSFIRHTNKLTIVRNTVGSLEWCQIRLFCIVTVKFDLFTRKTAFVFSYSRDILFRFREKFGLTSCITEGSSFSQDWCDQRG